jgi:hypothetical protein
MRTRILFAYLFIAALATTVYAVEPLHKERTLAIHHAEGKVTTERVDGNVIDTVRLADRMDFDLRSDETIRVTVDDQNPLVYTYAWKGVIRTKTADYEEALKFVDTLSGLETAFAPLLATTATETRQSTQIDAHGRSITTTETVTPALSPIDQLFIREGVTQQFLLDLARDIDAVRGFVKEIPDLTARSTGSKSAAEKVKEDVENAKIGDVANRIEKGMDKIVLAQMKAAQELLRGPADASGLGDNGSVSNTSDTASSQGTETRQSAPVSDCASPENCRHNGRDCHNCRTTTPPAVTEPPSPSSSVVQVAERSSVGAIERVAGMIKAQEDRVRTVIAGARSFAATAAKINEPLELGTIDFVASENALATVEIGAAANAKGSDVAERKTGTFKFGIEPYSPAHIKFGMAALYSFIEAPEYTAVAQSSGAFLITRTDNGNAVNGLTGAGMLSVTPRSWSNPVVGGSFQLGISPVTDKIGLFAGATIRVLDRFSFGGGIAYQQTQRLTGPLEEGATVAAADDLKTTTKFVPGAYVSFTFNLN